MSGGSGNDIMYGNSGGDTDLFSLDDGKDTIYETASIGYAHKLMCGSGLNPVDLWLRHVD
jgi:Ca2+-binding RTX toxin-like protein